MHLSPNALVVHCDWGSKLTNKPGLFHECNRFLRAVGISKYSLQAKLPPSRSEATQAAGLRILRVPNLLVF
jgi:hypothetical protein